MIVEVKKEQFLARCCLITLARSTLQIRQLLSCSALLQLHPVSEEVVTHLFVFSSEPICFSVLSPSPCRVCDRSDRPRFLAWH